MAEIFNVDKNITNFEEPEELKATYLGGDGIELQEFTGTDVAGVEAQATAAGINPFNLYGTGFQQGILPITEQPRIEAVKMGTPLEEPEVPLEPIEPFKPTTSPPEARQEIESILEEAVPDITDKETDRKGLFSKIAEAIRGKPEATAETRKTAEEEYGLTEKESKVSGILESAAKIKTQFLQQVEANRGRAISANLIRGREGLINRQMAIEMTGLAALADIAQGDVAAAQSKISQSVNEAIALEQANLDALQVELQATELTDVEKLRMQFMFDERTKNIAREEELLDQKKQLQLTLLQSGIQTASSETFDQMAAKLPQIYSREEERNLMSGLGMVYNPLTKKYETTAAQALAEEGLALDKARLALSREQALGNITNFETLMAELALRQELIGDDLTPEDIEAQKESIINDPNLTPEEKRKGIADLNRTKVVLERGETEQAKAFRKKWLDVIGGAAGGKVILETIKAGGAVAEKIVESADDDEGFFNRFFAQ